VVMCGCNMTDSRGSLVMTLPETFGIVGGLHVHVPE
jgi:hypothetical protein